MAVDVAGDVHRAIVVVDRVLLPAMWADVVIEYGDLFVAILTTWHGFLKSGNSIPYFVKRRTIKGLSSRDDAQLKEIPDSFEKTLEPPVLSRECLVNFLTYKMSLCDFALMLCISSFPRHITRIISH